MTTGATSFATLLRRHAADQPDRPALDTRTSSLSWSELDSAVDAVAAALLAMSLPSSAGHPARVALALPNDLSFPVHLLAVMRAGLVAVPVNPGFTGRELRHVLTDSGAALLIGTESVLAQVADLPLTALTEVTPSAQRPAEVPEAEIGVLLYTSGTAGAPKGAMLSHAALLANHAQIAAVTPPVMGREDVALLALPLFHAYGLNTGLGAVLWHGARGVLEQDFEPGETGRLIAAKGVTVVIGVPPMYVTWSRHPQARELLGGVRLFVCGAAALETEVARRFTAAVGATVHIGYGLTETAPVLTSTVVGGQAKPGSIGRPLPGVDLRLIGEDDEEDEHDPGEIEVRGANLFGGYWPDRHDRPDAEGWWRTGDVAYADAEGDLFLVDRIGELILVSGFNVYPAEVEQVLVAHPAVAEAAAVGIPHELTGQTVKVYVVRAAEVTAAELEEHCARNLARYKLPAAYEFVAELPHSVTGKVRKRLLGA